MKTTEKFDLMFGINRRIREFWNAVPKCNETLTRDVNRTEKQKYIDENPSEAMISAAENGDF